MITFTVTKTIPDEKLDAMVGAVRDNLADEIWDCLGEECQEDKSLSLKIAMEIYERLRCEIAKMYKES